MSNLVLRTLLLFAAVLFMMRVMGKRQIGELQPYEFAITLIAADLATTPMADINTPLLWGIIPLAVLLLVGLGISLLSLKSVKLRRLFCGKPCMLIDRGVIAEDTLRALRYTVNDLLEQLRSKDIFDVSQVYYAVLETNGEISVIPRSAVRTLQPADLQLSPEQEEAPIALVMDGKVQKENLKFANLKDDFLAKKLRQAGFHDPGELLLVTYTGSSMFFHGKGTNPKKKELKL